MTSDTIDSYRGLLLWSRLIQMNGTQDRVHRRCLQCATSVANTVLLLCRLSGRGQHNVCSSYIKNWSPAQSGCCPDQLSLNALHSVQKPTETTAFSLVLQLNKAYAALRRLGYNRNNCSHKPQTKTRCSSICCRGGIHPLCCSKPFRNKDTATPPQTVPGPTIPSRAAVTPPTWPLPVPCAAAEHGLLSR